MFKLIKRAKEIIRERGFKRFLIAVKYFLIKIFILTPINELFYYKRKSKIASFATEMIQGSKMILDFKDKGISKELFLYHLHEPGCTKIIKKELREGMTVIDIGANIGYYVLIEAQIVGSNGKIYAIEPEPRNYEILKKNIAINNYTNLVETYQMAISDRQGNYPLYIAQKRNLTTMGKLRHDQKSGIINRVEVKATSLDSFLENKRQSDFIRMDVEGFEYYIVKGMHKILQTDKPLKIFVEVHPQLIKANGEDIETMFETFSRYGFRVKYLIEEKLNVGFSGIKEYIFKGPILIKETITQYNKKSLTDLLKDRKIKNKLFNSDRGCGLFLERN